ncbi:MAG TPA: mannose-1-phosphate guanylyltransferase [Pirellulaceae bacterium]|nr:mannose-1-phosphate guanylyltransferase [Pirellulaceae bacterium]
MLHAVIMAGGSGTRFWPASRELKPKQLLALTGERSMIRETVDRLGDLVPADRLLVLTNRNLVGAVREQLPELDATAILGEPCRRDTAPCIGLAAAIAMIDDPDAVLVVMPSDHVIGPDDLYRRTLRKGVELVEQGENRIVTFGIRPLYPAEIYGYIERRNEAAIDLDGISAYRVASFHEKPNATRAAEYLATGRFAWNSGIFVWKARTILDALARFEPAMHAHLTAIAAAYGRPDFDQVFEREFTALEGRSIDYAVMERFDGETFVIDAPFSWDDLGNWPALARLIGTDPQGNAVQGRHLGIDTTGSIIRTDDRHLIVTVGIDDCIVVHTEDATLVARRSHEEQIRKVVAALRERHWTDWL